MTVNTTMGKITASKDVLSRLSVALYKAADYVQEKEGVEKHDVRRYNKAATEIVCELITAGYYHD